MNAEFEKIVNYVFKEEEIEFVDYDKSLSENGLDSLSIISFVMLVHQNDNSLAPSLFDDIDLTRYTIRELGEVAYGSIN